MSNRSLVELNHDYTAAMNDPGFLRALGRYLRSADTDSAADLELYGVTVVGMRHHSDRFVIRDDADGFPPHYLKSAAPVDTLPKGRDAEERLGAKQG